MTRARVCVLCNPHPIILVQQPHEQVERERGDEHDERVHPHFLRVMHREWRDRHQHGGKRADTRTEQSLAKRKRKRDGCRAKENRKETNREFGGAGNWKIEMQEVIVERGMRINVNTFERDRVQTAARGIDAVSFVAPHPQRGRVPDSQGEREEEDRAHEDCPFVIASREAAKQSPFVRGRLLRRTPALAGGAGENRSSQ